MLLSDPVVGLWIDTLLSAISISLFLVNFVDFERFINDREHSSNRKNTTSAVIHIVYPSENETKSPKVPHWNFLTLSGLTNVSRCPAGEVLGQQVRTPERFQIPSTRARPPAPVAARAVVTGAQSNANAIGRPSNKLSPKSQQNSSQPLVQAAAQTPPVSVKELFNSSSCVEPPFTCPHPRIQFFLYTR